MAHMIVLVLAIAASAYGFQKIAQRVNCVLADRIMNMLAVLLRDYYARKPHHAQVLRNDALGNAECIGYCIDTAWTGTQQSHNFYT